MSLNKLSSDNNNIFKYTGQLKAILMSLFLLLNKNTYSGSTAIQDEKDIYQTENIDSSPKLINLKSAVKTRNYYIDKSIDNFTNENTTSIPIGYDIYQPTLDEFANDSNLLLPASIHFDAKNHQLVIGDRGIKIDVPEFDYVYETWLGDLDLRVTKFNFKKFVYKKDEDSFFFTIDMDYECENSALLDKIIKVLNLDSSTMEIAFSKDGLKKILEIYKNHDNASDIAEGKSVSGSYTMTDEDNKPVTDVSLKIVPLK